MSFFRVLFAIVFPPIAVIDEGCGSVLIIFLLTLCGWIPGVIGALVILNNPKSELRLLLLNTKELAFIITKNYVICSPVLTALEACNKITFPWVL